MIEEVCNEITLESGLPAKKETDLVTVCLLRPSLYSGSFYIGNVTYFHRCPNMVLRHLEANVRLRRMKDYC